MIDPIEHDSHLPPLKPLEPHVLHEKTEQILGITVDERKLQGNKAYALDMLNQMLYAAKDALDNNLYNEAVRHYQLFFQYQGFMPLSFSERLAIQFPVLLDYSYALLGLGEEKQAERLMNRELLSLLESGLHQAKPQAYQTAHAQIQRLQDSSQLPNPAHLDVQVSPEVLHQLAEAFLHAGEQEIAAALLGYSETRQIFNLYQTRLRLHQIFGAPLSPVSPEEAMPLQHPLWYSHWGLPVIAILPPLPPEERQKFKHPSIKPVDWVERITPVQPVDDNVLADRERHPHSLPQPKKDKPSI